MHEDMFWHIVKQTLTGLRSIIDENEGAFADDEIHDLIAAAGTLASAVRG